MLSDRNIVRHITRCIVMKKIHYKSVPRVKWHKIDHYFTLRYWAIYPEIWNIGPDIDIFGLKVYNIVLGYLIDHIKPNTIQFEGFHIIMECPPNGPLCLATGVWLNNKMINRDW